MHVATAEWPAEQHTHGTIYIVQHQGAYLGVIIVGQKA